MVPQLESGYVYFVPQITSSVQQWCSQLLEGLHKRMNSPFATTFQDPYWPMGSHDLRQSH